MKKRILFMMSFLSFLGCSARSQTIDNSVVASVNLDRYLGIWYEIARFDHKFERGMDYTKAQYTLLEDGKISVLNTGMKNGQPAEARGKAKTTDYPALLRVSFFGPFYADYRIMLLDSDYRYALIGSGSNKYLWILSRTSQLPVGAKDELLAEAKRRGYDVGQLIWVKQE